MTDALIRWSVIYNANNINLCWGAASRAWEIGLRLGGCKEESGEGSDPRWLAPHHYCHYSPIGTHRWTAFQFRAAASSHSGYTQLWCGGDGHRSTVAHRFPRHLLAVNGSLLILMPMRHSWFAGYGRDWWGKQCKDIQCTHYWPQTYMDIQSKNENGNIHANDTRMSKIDSALF